MKKGSTILRIAGSHMLLLTAAAADQMMKRRVEARFREGEAAILNSHLVIHRSRNSGAAMNIGQEIPDAVKALSLCAAAAGEMALVLGGGAGNIMDRYRQGYVTDYIRLPRLPGRMGKTVFNLGDFMILSGAALLITARAFSE